MSIEKQDEIKVVIGEGGQLRLGCARPGCGRISSWFEFGRGGRASFHFRNRHDNETHEHIITAGLLGRVLDAQIEAKRAELARLEQKIELVSKQLAA